MISISLWELGGGQVGKARWVRTEFLCMYHRWPKSTRHFFGFLSTLFFSKTRVFWVGWSGFSSGSPIFPLSLSLIPNPRIFSHTFEYPRTPGSGKKMGGRWRASHSLFP